MSVLMDPFEPNDVGMYTVGINTCVTYIVNGNTGETAQTCESSTPFTVEVQDPCETAVVQAFGFDRVLSAPQLRQDSLFLPQEIIQTNNNANAWPWTTNVDIAVGGTFGPNLCGDIVYSIVPQNTADPFQANLVTFDSSGVNPSLEFNPTLNNVPGTYDMWLYGTLPNGNWSRVAF